MAFQRPMKAAAPVAAAKAQPKKPEFVPGMPVATLSVKPAGEQESQIITGLFERTDKKGNKFLTGKSKEDPVRYFVQDGKEGKKLSCAEGEKSGFTEVCLLKECQGKKGMFLAGEDTDKNKFYVFFKKD